MSKNRIKTQVPTIATREEAEAVMNALALVANSKQIISGRMDKELLAIKEKYSGQIAECDEVLKIETRKLEVWATANPGAFGKKKSIEFLSGTLGFRTGTPKLALISRAWNWNKVLAEIKKLPKWAALFIRTKEEVDKDAIITAGTKTPAIGIQCIGVKVVQDESFYVEPHLTDTEVQS